MLKMRLSLRTNTSLINRPLKSIEALTNRTGMLKLKTGLLTQHEPQTEIAIPTLKRVVGQFENISGRLRTRTTHDHAPNAD
jgi:hypothetical protein